MKQDAIFGKRILLVEDNPSARQSTKLLLNIDRHHVAEAKDGLEALDLIARQPFDLVLLDFFMPGMQGGEVALKIKRIAPSVPILMVTAYLEKLSGVDMPVNAVLSKPFAVDDLRSEIARLLSGPTSGAAKS
jgi:CheY-like chemotaxis protein